MYLKNYLLSVVIPTKNRSTYLKNCIYQVFNATNDEVEIIIQDNSDKPILNSETLNSYDKRIKYFYTNDNLSFVENFESAVKKATGEYVILIGDDDGILPNIIDLVFWAKENNCDAITSKILVTYYWPHSGAKNYKCTEDKGYIRINNIKNNIYLIDHYKNFIKVIKNACQFYHSSKIPKIYHGIVKKELVEKIIQKNGKLFSGLSPDIYSSFMISMYAKKVGYSEIPYSIDGNCSKSGAGAQAQGKHEGELKDAPHFNGNTEYQWNKKVPYIYSIQTIWAESALTALEDNKRDDLSKLFNTEKLTAYIILNNPKIRYQTFHLYKELTNRSNLSSFICIFVSALYGPFTNYIIRILKRILGRGQVGYIINNVEDITQASKKINDYINKQGVK